MTERDQEQIAVEEQTEAGPTVSMEIEPKEKAAPEEAEPEPDELAALRAQLEQIQTKSNEYLDGWQRARAEFTNYRRREEQRWKRMNEEARSRFLLRLLPVLDDLGRAFEAVPEDTRGSSWAKGLSLVGHKLRTVLEKEGLSVMSVQPGDAFDPNYHGAVLWEPSEEFEEGEIVQVLQQGYELDESVLRPALVRVSSGRRDEESEST